MSELEKRILKCIESIEELEEIVKELLAENYKLKSMIKIVKEFDNDTNEQK